MVVVVAWPDPAEFDACAGADCELEPAEPADELVTGHTVVDAGTVEVTVYVLWAGQLDTVVGQAVTVITVVA